MYLLNCGRILSFGELAPYEVYRDEQVYARIENIYNYFKENLRMMTWEEFAGLRPDCRIEDYSHSDDVVEEGLRGIIHSDNYAMEKLAVRITVLDGEEVFYQEWIPEGPHYYDLSQQTDITAFIQSLPDGVYNLEADAWVDSEAESYSGLLGMIFTTGDAVWP